MNTHRSGAILLLCVALLALITALAHMSCIVLGAECYRAQMAPEYLIELSQTTPWQAAFETTLVSMLFVACAVYCLSGARFIKKLPLLKQAMITISSICMLRGLATVPLSLMFPNNITTFSIVAGALWFLAGLFCFVGYRIICRTS